VLPILSDVKHFAGVRFHRGNTAKDTAGCLIVGENKVPGMVINSTGYETMLVSAIMNAIERGEIIHLEII